MFDPDRLASGKRFQPRFKSGVTADGDDLVSRLAAHLDHPAHQVAVLGDSGVGKSSLLQHVAGARGTVISFFRCTRKTVLSDILAHVDPVRVSQRTRGASGNAGALGGGVGFDKSSTREFAERAFPERLSAAMKGKGLHLLALDNFHKIEDRDVQLDVLDTMEAFHEEASPGLVQKVFVLGIADRLADVLRQHDEGGLRRHKQLVVPRMDALEIQSIYQFGFERLGIEVAEPILNRMIFVADGYPYFAHLVGQLLAKRAIGKPGKPVDEDMLFLAFEDIKDRYEATEFERYRQASEKKGVNTPTARPKKHALLMLARDEDRSEWSVSQASVRWSNFYPDYDRQPAEIRKTLEALASGPNALLKKRKESGQNMYRFAGPVTRVCLRIMSHQNDDGVWDLHNPY